MNLPQWGLAVVAFLLGLVLTFALMIRRVRREVPVSASTGPASNAISAQTTSRETTTKIPITQESPTTEIPVGREGSTTKIPIAQEPPMTWYPAGYQAPPALRRNRHWPWWTLAVAFLVAGVALAATLTVSSHHSRTSRSSIAPTPPAPPTPPLVAVAALPGLLLPSQQIADILGATNMSKGAKAPGLLPDDKNGIAETDCLGAWTAAQPSVYANTGMTGAFTSLVMADEVPMHHMAYQSVITYPTADAADKVVANQFAQWSACSGRTVTVFRAAPQPPRLFTLGPVTNTSGILSMTETSVDNPTWGCQRALAARRNAIIDIRTCRPDTTTQAVDVLNAITAKLPH